MSLRAERRVFVRENSTSFSCGCKYDSAEATFDIIRQYADLPHATLDEFSMYLDSSSNGMILTYIPFLQFDTYGWGLKATEVSEVLFERFHFVPFLMFPLYIGST